MPSVALLNQAGEKVNDLVLSEEVFGIEPNKQVLFDVVYAQRAAMRQGTADTKTKSEVSGGGKKPWRQKGTGRARQGSTRSAQWRHGGIVFGPHPRDYEFKVNRKVRQLGLKSALSYKVAEQKLVVVDKIVLDAVKTKDFAQVLKNINADGKTLVLDVNVNENLALSARNLPNVCLEPVSHVSVYDILNYTNLVLTEESVKYFEEVLA